MRMDPLDADHECAQQVNTLGAGLGDDTDMCLPSTNLSSTTLRQKIVMELETCTTQLRITTSATVKLVQTPLWPGTLSQVINLVPIHLVHVNRRLRWHVQVCPIEALSLHSLQKSTSREETWRARSSKHTRLVLCVRMLLMTRCTWTSRLWQHRHKNHYLRVNTAMGAVMSIPVFLMMP